MSWEGGGFSPGPCSPRHTYRSNAVSGKTSTWMSVLAAHRHVACTLHISHPHQTHVYLSALFLQLVTPHLVPRAWEAGRHLGAVLPRAQVIIRLQLHAAIALSHRTLSWKNVKACGFHLPVLGLTCSQESANIFRRESDSKYLGFVGQMIS